MEKYNPLLAVRHLEDRDSLLSEGLDGGLVENQEAKTAQIAKEIIELSEKSDTDHVDIFSSDQRRTSETASLVVKEIERSNPGLSNVSIDQRLRGLNKGIPNLPVGYKDGDQFAPLKDAWDPFWEHVRSGDIFYRFGQAATKDGVVYKELEGMFVEEGECYAEIMERHLDFLHSVLMQDSSKSLKVFIGHSINIRILKEVVLILKDHSRTVSPMPIGKISEKSEDYLDNKNQKYGEIESIDLSGLTEGLSTDQIDQELQILRAKMVQARSLV